MFWNTTLSQYQKIRQDFNFHKVVSGIHLTELLSTDAAGRYIWVTQLDSFYCCWREKDIIKSHFIWYFKSVNQDEMRGFLGAADSYSCLQKEAGIPC